MELAKRTFLIALIPLCISVIWLGIVPHEAPRVFLNQRSAARGISDVSVAENKYAAQHQQAGYACNLSNLGEEGLVDAVLASSTRAGYHFEIQCPQNGVQKFTSYTITAVPVSPGNTGKYALCTDQTGDVWYSDSGVPSDCLAMHKPIERKYK